MDGAGPGPDDPEVGRTVSGLARRLFSGGIFAFAGKVVKGGGTALVSVLLTRLLSPSSVGAYFLALSVATAGALLARLGLEKTVLQKVAGSLGLGARARARAVVKRVFIIATATVAIVVAIIGLGGGRWLASHVFSSPPMAAIAVLMAPWTALLAFEILVAETFRGLHDIPRASIYGGAISASLCVVAFSTLLFVNADVSLRAAVIVTLACAAVGLLLAGHSMLRRVRELNGTPIEPVSTAEVLQTTWPLFISNITLFMTGQADIWILGAFRPDEEVAIYATSLRLVILVAMSLTIVNAVLPPVIGELHVQRQKERLERVIRTTTSLAAIPSFILLATFIVWGRPILEVVFGPFYGGGAPVLLLLSFAQLSNVWVGSCGYTLVMTGHQRDLMRSALLSSGISVFGALALVQPFGATGVALAVGLGTTVHQFVMLGLARRRCGIWTHASFRLALESLKAVPALVRQGLGSADGKG